MTAGWSATSSARGVPITLYGDGRQTRSFCFVDDLVDGLLAMMAHDGAQPGPVNLGNPHELTMLDLVERVVQLTGSRSPVVHLPLPTDDPRRRKPDIGRARALLHWLPRIDLQPGLEATIPYFARQLGVATALIAAAAD